MTKKFLNENKSPNINKINKVNTSFYKIIGLGIIFIGALIIRLHPVISSPEKIRAGFGPFGDTHFYHRIAYNLYRGNGFSATNDGTTYGLGEKKGKSGIRTHSYTWAGLPILYVYCIQIFG